MPFDLACLLINQHLPSVNRVTVTNLNLFSIVGTEFDLITVSSAGLVKYNWSQCA